MVLKDPMLTDVINHRGPRLARAGRESPPQVFDGALGGSGQVKQAKGIPLVKNGRGNTSYVVCVCVGTEALAKEERHSVFGFAVKRDEKDY